MIATVTPNPALVHEVSVARLVPGALHEPVRTRIESAGEGIEVSRIVHRLGCPTMAFGFLAGSLGPLVESALEREGVPHHFVHVPGQTRVVLGIVEDSGVSTCFQGAGPRIPLDRLALLEEVVMQWLLPGGVLVLTDPLAPGMETESFSTVAKRSREHEVRVVVHLDDDALVAALAAGPDVVVTDVEQSARLVERALPDEDASLFAAREIVRRGARAAVLSMGVRGAIYVDRAGSAWRAAGAVPARPGSAPLLAGVALALARGIPAPAMLRLALAARDVSARSSVTPASVRAALGRVDVQPILIEEDVTGARA